METVHLIISGKVQGVFYRASAKKKAEELNINGWIKNTREGNVEAMISGEKEAVDRFVRWCKAGPERAVVEDVRVYIKELLEFDSFKVEK